MKPCQKHWRVFDSFGTQLVNCCLLTAAHDGNVLYPTLEEIFNLPREWLSGCLSGFDDVPLKDSPSEDYKDGWDFGKEAWELLSKEFICDK